MIFSESNEVKLVILVRMDLKMGNGKIAAQCAHVTLKAFQKSRNKAQSNS
jgi:peptidyl-tRNA hydrolase